MPTARNETYAIASGGSGYFGQSAPATYLPASGNWAQIANSRFDLSGTGLPNYPAGDGSFSSSTWLWSITGWNGAVAVTKGVNAQGTKIPGTHMVIAAAGGHGDYFGNEARAFGPLEYDNPIWRLLYLPNNPSLKNVAIGPNGEAVSSHNYNLEHFAPDLGNMGSIVRLAVGAQPGNGFGAPTTQYLDLETNVWKRAATPDLPNMSGDINYACGDINPITGKIVLAPNGSQGRFWIFDTLTTQTSATPFVQSGNFANNSKGCVDPVRNLLIQMKSTGGVQYADIAGIAGMANPATLTTAGSGPSSTGIYSMEWHPGLGCAIVMERNSSASWALTPSSPTGTGGTWNWTSLPLNGTSCSSTVWGNGVYGRMRIVKLGTRYFLVLITNESSLVNIYGF